jgi:hypothetical protein
VIPYFLLYVVIPFSFDPWSFICGNLVRYKMMSSWRGIHLWLIDAGGTGGSESFNTEFPA